MSRFRTRWLALFGAVTLLSLSLSTALAGKPDGENRGQQVSAFVHSLQEADEETEEDTETEDDTETDEETEEEEESAPSDHGQCVALVAQDKEAVGPPNDNHGGAVSEAARVTCWEEGSSEETGGEEGADEENEAEEDAEDSEESEESEDADDSSSANEHGNGHGHGHDK